MKSPSIAVFESINSWDRLLELISNGESEGIYYECKSPIEPKLNKDMQKHLAKACSGFANTNGGIVIYGMSTVHHGHSDLDVMAQLEPIGQVTNFAKQVENSIPALSTPAILKPEIRIIKEKESDTKGVVIVHIPKFSSDPVQSAIDELFYFRSGDDFVVAPYDMIRRFFAAAESPELELIYVAGILKQSPGNGPWAIPVVLRNNSAAIAEHVKVVVSVADPTQYANVSSNSIRDASEINPGNFRTYISNLDGVIHKGINHVVGHIHVGFKADNPTKGIVAMNVAVYANRMEFRKFDYTLTIAEGGLANAQIQPMENDEN